MMTNEQKYKTPEERIKAFGKFCNGNGKGCTNCILKDRPVGSASCAFYWLSLEAEEKKPEPCPFCDGKCVEATPCEEHPHIVKCVECGYHTPEYAYKTFADAVTAHNRVARAVRAAKESEVK